MKIKNFFFFFFLFLFSLSKAQNVSFVASANAEKIDNAQYRTYLGDYIEVSYMVMNGVGKNFIAPKISDFNIISGPNSYNVEQIINGTRQSKYGFTYTLQPKKNGRFLIPPAQIEVNGQKIQSTPLVIEVIKDQTFDKNAKSDPVILKIKTDKKEYYLGEKILATYQILSVVDIQDYEITNQPLFKDFLVQPLQLIDNEPTKERINGRTYQSFTLEKKFLFPQKTGNISLESISANLMVATKEKTIGGMMIPSSQAVAVESAPTSILIKDLPIGAPKDFSGAIGTWEMQLEGNQNQISTDQTLVINLLIKGDGDIKRMIPPKFATSDSLNFYEPKIIEEGIGPDENGNPISFKKMEYLIVPKYAGNYVIQPSLSVFDTEQNAYVDLKTSPFSFSVSQGNNIVKNDVEENITTSKSTFWQKNKNIFFIIIGLILLVGIMAFFFKNIKRNKEKNIEKEIKKPEINNIVEKKIEIKTINPLVENNLTLAEKNLLSNNYDAFYKNIYQAIISKTEEKYKLSSGKLNEKNVAELLLPLGSDEQLCDEITQLLKTCNFSLYAGKKEYQAGEDFLTKAKSILSKI